MDDSKERKGHHYADLHHLNFFKKLKHFDGDFTDVTICCTSGQPIKAHKLILSIGSDYFGAMFSVEMRESNSEMVYIHDTPSDIVKIVLDFIYYGEVGGVNDDNVLDVAMAADKFLLPGLRDFCKSFIERISTKERLVDMYNSIESFNIPWMEGHLFKLMESNFNYLANEGAIEKLSPNCMKQLIVSENIVIDNELEVLEAALKWLNHLPNERISHCSDILGAIRYLLIPNSKLQNLLQNESNSIIKHHLEKLITTATTQPLICFSTLNCIPREKCKTNLYIASSSTNSLWCYDVTKQNTDLVCNLEMDTRRLCGVIGLHGKLYIFGGETSHKQILGDGVAICPLTKSQERMANMLEPKSEFGVAAYNKCIYVFGGVVGDAVSKSIEKYSPSVDKWERLDLQLPEPLYGFSVVVHDNLLYILCGRDDDHDPVCVLYVFNPCTDKWNCISSTAPNGRCSASLLNENIIMVNTETSRRQKPRVYSINEKMWSECSQLPVRGRYSVLCIKGKVCFVGQDDEGVKFIDDFNETPRKILGLGHTVTGFVVL